MPIVRRTRADLDLSKVDWHRVAATTDREITKQIAVIEHKLSEITKTKELWRQRGWMILTICLSAFFSFLAVILGALLTSYLNTKK